MRDLLKHMAEKLSCNFVTVPLVVPLPLQEFPASIPDLLASDGVF